MATKEDLQQLAAVLHELSVAFLYQQSVTFEWQSTHTQDEYLDRTWDRPARAVLALESFPVDSLAGAKLPTDHETWWRSLVDAGQHVLHGGDDSREQRDEWVMVLNKGRWDLRLAILQAKPSKDRGEKLLNAANGEVVNERDFLAALLLKHHFKSDGDVKEPSAPKYKEIVDLSKKKLNPPKITRLMKQLFDGGYKTYATMLKNDPERLQQHLKGDPYINQAVGEYNDELHSPRR